MFDQTSCHSFIAVGDTDVVTVPLKCQSLPSTDDNSPIKVTQDALTVYQNQFTARWEGIMGDDHVPRYDKLTIYE